MEQRATPVQMSIAVLGLGALGLGLFAPLGAGSLLQALWSEPALGNVSLGWARLFAALCLLTIAAVATSLRSPGASGHTSAAASWSTALLAAVALTILGVQSASGFIAPVPHRPSVSGIPWTVLCATLAAAVMRAQRSWVYEPGAGDSTLPPRPSAHGFSDTKLALAWSLMVSGALLWPAWPQGKLALAAISALMQPQSTPSQAALAVWLAAVFTSAAAVWPGAPKWSQTSLVALASAVLFGPIVVHLAAGGSAALGLCAAGLALLLFRALLAAAPLTEPHGALRARARGAASAEGLALLVAAGLWWLLKTHGLAASNTDENIYFYGAWLWSQGEWPYRDFFFAHPPLHLAIPAALFKVFGWSLTGAKLIAPAAAFVAGGFAWAIARRAYGKWAGLVALVGYLYASEVLKASTNLTGVNLTSAFITAALWAATRKRYGLSGALFGAACQVGFYALAGIAPVLLAAFFWRKRAALQMATGFFGVFLPIALAAYGLAGDAYLDGVFRYHALKPVAVEGHVPVFGPGGQGLTATFHNFFVAFPKSERFLGNLYYHGTLWWSSAVAAALVLGTHLAAFARRARRSSAPPSVEPGGAARLPDTTALLMLGVALAYFGELAQLRELFDYYFVLPFPALAVLAAYLARELWRLGAEVLERLEQRAPVLGSAALLAAMLVTLAATGGVRAWANERAWPEEAARRGERVEFDWTDPPVLPGLSGIVFHAFWRSSRTRGDLQPGYAHYLWSKKRWFSTAESMAQRIRETTPESATLLGSSTATPLLALLSGRRIAANEVDTNTKRLKAGLLTHEALFRRACETPLSILVLGPQSMFEPRSASSWPVVREYFELDSRYADPWLRHFGSTELVLMRRIAPAAGAPPYCRWIDTSPAREAVKK